MKCCGEIHPIQNGPLGMLVAQARLVAGQTPGGLVRGATGVVQATLRLDRAPAGLVSRRRDACRACPEATRNRRQLHLPTRGLTSLSACLVCGCNLFKKSQLRTPPEPCALWQALEGTEGTTT